MNLPWLAVGLLSAAALAYEVLLTRLFAIAFWHHFAHLIISLALLGYGISGSFLAFARPALERRFDVAFTVNVAAFAVSAPLCVALSQRLGFNPLELAWAPDQWFRFSAIYLLLALPFFAAANAIALALWRSSASIHRVYAADLVGAGLGSLGVLVLLFTLDVDQALSVVTLTGSIAMGIAAARIPGRSRWGGTSAAVVIALLAWFMPSIWVAPVPSEYKDLSQAMRVAGARIVERRSGPMAELVAVENREVPVRIAPGMSLSRGRGIPEQMAVFADGNLVGPVTRRDPADPEGTAYLDVLPSALPFHLYRAAHSGEGPEVLVLGAGTGEPIVQALYLGARRVAATEENPDLLALTGEDLAGLSGGLFQDDRLTVKEVPERAFAAVSRDTFDLVIMDVAGGAIAGLGTANETPELTRESMERYYARLNSGGMLALSQPLASPPRLALKLALTLMQVAEGQGDDPARQLVVARGWRHLVLVLKKGPLTEAELEAARAFCRDRSFDLSYLPGLDRTETNKYNRLAEPLIHDGVVALLGSARAEYLRQYKFDLRPATDERPFAYDFFRWGTFEEQWHQARSGAVAQMEWGYLVLLATLAQALVLSLLLILLPVLARRGARSARLPGAARLTAAVVVYFGAVGIAFLCVEIAFVQGLQRLLHHPVFAVSTVLAAFLVFAGLGSMAGPKVQSLVGARRMWPLAVGIGVAAVVPFALVGTVADLAAAWPLVVRIGVAIAFLAPLAFMMGVPFPSGLRAVSEGDASRLPLAWAVNGCASVVAAVGALWVALEWGFGATLGLGLVMYTVAALAFPALGGIRDRDDREGPMAATPGPAEKGLPLEG